MKFFLYFSCRY